MPFHVVLVGPKYPGNVGSVARAMANFDLEHLWLVGGCPITEEARDMAVHAQRILDDARRVASFDDVARHMNHLAAFGARRSLKGSKHARQPLAIGDWRDRVAELEGDIAVVFGPEDHGLDNDVVEACDVLVRIPTSPNYPSMNLSHAATVVFYELFHRQYDVERPRAASAADRELLMRYLDAYLEAIRQHPHRRDLTKNMFRRVIGRAGLSTWEYHRMMGLFSPALKRLGHWPVEGLPEEAPGEEQAEASDDAADERDAAPDGARHPRRS